MCACVLVCIGVYVSGCVCDKGACGVCYVSKCVHVTEHVYVRVSMSVPFQEKKKSQKTARDHLVSHHISRFIAPLLWKNISQ